MDKNKLLERIAIDPKVMVGKPVIRGTRLTVQFVLGLLAAGETIEGILAEYRGLEREDVLACLHFATQTLDGTLFVPMTPEAA